MSRKWVASASCFGLNCGKINDSLPFPNLASGSVRSKGDENGISSRYIDKIDIQIKYRLMLAVVKELIIKQASVMFFTYT